MITLRLQASFVMLFLVPLSLQANELEGVWLFQKEINKTAARDVIKVPGPAYEGVLIYTRSGYVSVQMMPKSRPWRLANATLDELRQTVGQGSSTGYAGRYSIDARTATVTHTPLVSMDPADEGQRLVRNYSLDGNVLKLSGTWTYEGQKLFFEVYWTRAD